MLQRIIFILILELQTITPVTKRKFHMSINPQHRLTFYAIAFTMFIAVALMSCEPTSEKTTKETPETKEINPAAEGFLTDQSDAQAISIADQVMEAMGGRQAWDQTRHIQWNFFGRRMHYWDKETGDIRIESPAQNLTILMNIHNMEGKVSRADQEITEQDSVAIYLERGKSWWINDSYWLVMPFKLKDTGVALKHLGKDTTMDGQSAEVLSLTFQEVGVTPNNKYHVYVDSATQLISQWAYFATADLDSANIITPWSNYQPFGEIMLSDGRGRGSLTDISVHENLPEELYTDFAFALEQ